MMVLSPDRMPPPPASVTKFRSSLCGGVEGGTQPSTSCLSVCMYVQLAMDYLLCLCAEEEDARCNTLAQLVRLGQHLHQASDKRGTLCSSPYNLHCKSMAANSHSGSAV